MRIKPIRCPSCDAKIEIKESEDTCECQYCGCVFSIDNGKSEHTYNKNINIKKEISHTRHHIDDAAVIKAQSKAKEDRNMWFMIAFLMIFSWGTLFFLGAKEEMEKKVAVQNGMISAGSYEDFIGMKYKGAVAHLEGAGFTNIEAVDLDDAGIFFWNNGKVEQISIGGDMDFSSNDYFDPDTKVVISYR